MSGQKSVVSNQEPLPPTPSPLGSFYPGNRGLQAESKAKRDRPTHRSTIPRGPGRRNALAQGVGNREWGVGFSDSKS